jgi:L-threonylcarbamoyladenylate synthase
MAIFNTDDIAILQAADLLKQGQLVAFPTETVYGLGADASNPEAVVKIFAAKGRPANHPLIVHLADAKQLNDWATDIPEAAWRLAQAFWPGPLSMILKKQDGVSDVVTGGQDSVGLRVPNNAVALKLLRAFGGGIAAPSANRFGRISPTRAADVAEELGDKVACILDGGECEVGVESTIIDLSSDYPALLRPGRITRSQLETVLQTSLTLKPQHKIRAPGMMAAHYAPKTLSYLCSGAKINETVLRYAAAGKKIGVLSCQNMPPEHLAVTVIRLPFLPYRYENALYHSLRKLDTRQLDVILIERPDDNENWHAVLDRLSKATVGEIIE